MVTARIPTFLRCGAFSLLASALLAVGLAACQKETVCPPPPPVKPCPTPATAAAASTVPMPPPAAGPGELPAGTLLVAPDEGHNSFSAVFEAPLGERITANSSSVDCSVSYDDKTNSFSGGCSVPLTSIMVDNDSTKTEHFQQWSTNKKSEAKDCRYEAKFDSVKLASSLVAGVPAKFSVDVPFTVCGRARVDAGLEHIEGTAVLLPPAGDTPTKTVRVRAQIDGFSRDKYHIGPAYTDGWLARVQKLANVVADQGSITLSLFARTKE